LSNKKKIKVLFVGSFLSKTKSGGLGGQMFASKTLTESNLNENITWIKIDSTALSNIKTALFIRLFRAILRLIKFTFHVVFSGVDKVLIFTGSGASFKEKGFMALIAKTFGKYVIIAPRSGLILEDFKTKNKNFIGKVFSKVDLVICQSESWKNTFQQEFPNLTQSKFKVVYNALDTAKYAAAFMPKKNAVSEIVFIAWMDRNKGVFELMQAAENLKKEGLSFKLTMCGHGRDFDAVQALVKEKGIEDCVQLLGWIYEEEKNKILNRADIFVLPTFFEGMPNALLEAMACGLPSVASSVGAIPDMMQDKVHGLLVAPGSVNDLTAALKTLLQDENARLTYGKAARERILKDHAVEVVIDKYRAIFLNNEAILIDMSPLKSGGGVQLAYNFLDELKCADIKSNDLYLLVPEGDFIEYRNHPKIKGVISAPRSKIKRFFFENFTLQTWLSKRKIKTIFTFFGSGLPHPKSIRSVVGVAYPSICYPDSPFWKYLPSFTKYKTAIINYYRIKRLSKANIIFVETEIMKKRLMNILRMKEENIFLIPPSPSNYVKTQTAQPSLPKRVLLLSGNSPQKNLWRLYAIACELKKLNYKLKFVISLSADEWRSGLKEEAIDENIVHEYFEFIGVIHQKDISKAYENIDVLLMLSDLESFSNNHMEAWKVGVPQVVSDRDFARGICVDSAVYIEPHHPRQVAHTLSEVLNDDDLLKTLVERGKTYLEKLPSQQERMQMILQLILD
jgi:glycosyltransferase involved in cell wall biosynthesis